MTDLAGLRGAALALPGVVEATHFRLPTFTVAGKGFATVEGGGTTAVLAVGEATTAELIAADPELFEPVRRSEKILVGVRVHLAALPADRLGPLLEAAWRTKAPKTLQATYTG